MRTESKEHRDIINYLCNKLHGKNNDIVSRRSAGYYPDIETSKEDIEVEMLNKSDHILRKSKNWNHKKKKVLVIGIHKSIEELFDEIVLFKSKRFERD